MSKVNNNLKKVTNYRDEREYVFYINWDKLLQKRIN